MNRPADRRRGRRLADALAGSWRARPPSLSLTAGQLDELLPLLLAGGVAPLLWPRVRETTLEHSPSAAPLRDAARFQLLTAEVQARELAGAFRALGKAGVPALLGRGYAAARLYPEPALRPYVDHDLAVRPADYDRARAALSHLEWRFDLHAGFAELDDRPFELLLARAERFRVSGVEVTGLGAEDHLRLLCLHAFRHGVWRALWLCDLGAALERAGLDERRLFEGSPHRSRAIACALGLAGRLLGARAPAVNLPAWLAPALLGEWGRRVRYQDPILSYLAHPFSLLPALADHFPNPIAASLDVGAPFDERSPVPYQLLAAAKRAWNLLR